MHAKDDLKTAHDNATQAHEHALARAARIDMVLAAMMLIDDSPADCDALTDEDLVALDMADNAQAFAKLTATRATLDAEIIRLEELARAAWRAYDAEPEDIN